MPESESLTRTKRNDLLLSEDCPMPDFFKPLIRTANWIKTRNQESADPPCALASCAGPHSLWQRFRKRRRPSGTFLQGVFYAGRNAWKLL